jgi:hypothetical protein
MLVPCFLPVCSQPKPIISSNQKKKLPPRPIPSHTVPLFISGSHSQVKGAMYTTKTERGKVKILFLGRAFRVSNPFVHAIPKEKNEKKKSGQLSAFESCSAAHADYTVSRLPHPRRGERIERNYKLRYSYALKQGEEENIVCMCEREKVPRLFMPKQQKASE